MSSFPCQANILCGSQLSIHPAIYLPTHPSTSLPAYLPTYLPICLPTHLSTCLPTYLPTNLPMDQSKHNHDTEANCTVISAEGLKTIEQEKWGA